ncbi:MAG TPA: EpsI family protein [Clostridia bacterium]|nr:EpsI family protein [Clostridia bacterium]
MKPNAKYWLVLVILVAATLGLNALSHGEPALPLHPISSIPLQFGAWVGQQRELEDRFVQALGVDDYLYRTYQRGNEIPVGLYIGFYATQRTGSTIHSPKNCLPGAGWQAIHADTIPLKRPDGSSAVANLYIVQKGLQKQLVVYWYQSHGRIVANEYWGKIYLVVDAIQLNRTDAALVRVVTPFEGSDQDARVRAAEFAQEIIGYVDAAVPR